MFGISNKKASIVSNDAAEYKRKSSKQRNSSQAKLPFRIRSGSRKYSLKRFEDIFSFRKFLTRLEELLGRKDIKPSDINEWENQYFYSERYVKDTIGYLRYLEEKFQLPEDIFVGQTEIHGNHRRIVADWLIQVGDHLQVEQDTLHLSMTYLDHFLIIRAITTDQMQLLAVVCLLIACKYVERQYPELRELCHLTEDSYTDKQVIQWERYVLRKLDYKLFIPEPVTFLDGLLRLCPENSVELNLLSRYLLDLLLCDHTSPHMLPSIRAAGCLCLAQKLIIAQNVGFVGSCWNTPLVAYSGYEENQLIPVLHRMAKLLQRLPESKCMKGAFQKYSGRKYKNISSLPVLTNENVLQQILMEK